MHRFKPMAKIVGVMFLLYAVQFLLFPKLFPYYFRTSNEAFAMYWITTILATIITAVFISHRFLDWIMGDIVYLLLPCLYSANGAYGTGLGNYGYIRLALIEISINAIIMFLYQGCIICIVLLINWIRKRNKRVS